MAILEFGVLQLKYKPIPGTTKLHCLQENISAVNLSLSTEDIQQIDKATSKISIKGARYPEALQNRVEK